MTGAALCAAMIAVFNPPADRVTEMCRQADHLVEVSRQYDTDPAVLAAVIWKESRWNPKAINHSSGCCGLAGTAAHLVPESCQDLTDAKVAIRAGARSLHYWKVRRGKRHYRTVLACYNAGNLCSSSAYATQVLRWAESINRLVGRPKVS